MVKFSQLTQNSHQMSLPVGEGRAVVDLSSNFCSRVQKWQNSKFPMSSWGGVRGRVGWPTFQLSFLISKNDTIPRSQFSKGGGIETLWPCDLLRRLLYASTVSLFLLRHSRKFTIVTVTVISLKGAFRGAQIQFEFSVTVSGEESSSFVTSQINCKGI